MISARRRGRAALAGAGLSVLIMTLVGVAGPSAAEPRVSRHQTFPPLYWSLHPSDALVTIALWTAVVLGTAAVLVGLSAIRGGWRPSLKRLLVYAVLCGAALTVTPPTGSTDLMDYATYGRMTVTGNSPYRTTPQEMRAIKDPVAAFSSHSWRKYRSVYGPLATAEEWAASSLGGTSAADTVFWLKMLNALAFLATALTLDRIAGKDRARRTRVHLLWTINPLMLWGVIAGGHIDGFAMALAVGGLWALRSTAVARRPVLAGLTGGLLLGGAAAVKAPFAMLAAAPAWTWRRAPKVLAAGALGVGLAVVPGYLVTGGSAVRSMARRSDKMSEMSLWHLLVKPFGYTPPAMLMSAGVAIGFVVLAAILIRGLPPEPEGGAGAAGVRLALACSLAWVMVSQVYFGWYEVLILPLLALMPASRADWLLVTRAGVAMLGSLPGMAITFHPPWVNTAVNGVLAVVAPATLLVLSCLLVIAAIRQDWGLPGDRPRAGSPSARPRRSLAPTPVRRLDQA